MTPPKRSCRSSRLLRSASSSTVNGTPHVAVEEAVGDIVLKADDSGASPNSERNVVAATSSEELFEARLELAGVVEHNAINSSAIDPSDRTFRPTVPISPSLRPPSLVRLSMESTTRVEEVRDGSRTRRKPSRQHLNVR